MWIRASPEAHKLASHESLSRITIKGVVSRCFAFVVYNASDVRPADALAADVEPVSQTLADNASDVRPAEALAAGVEPLISQTLAPWLTMQAMFGRPKSLQQVSSP